MAPSPWIGSGIANVRRMLARFNPEWPNSVAIPASGWGEFLLAAAFWRERMQLVLTPSADRNRSESRQ